MLPVILDVPAFVIEQFQPATLVLLPDASAVSTPRVSVKAAPLIVAEPSNVQVILPPVPLAATAIPLQFWVDDFKPIDAGFWSILAAVPSARANSNWVLPGLISARAAKKIF